MNTTITKELVSEVQKAIDGKYSVRIFDGKDGLFVGEHVASAYQNGEGLFTIIGEVMEASEFDEDYTLADYLSETVQNIEQNMRELEE